MKKKFLVLLLATSMISTMLTACGSSSESSDSSSSEDGDYSGQTLNVLTWEGDVADDEISDFEKKFGVDVNVTYVEDTNTILAKMLQGNCEYDVIDLESAYVNSFVEADLLAPLDYDKMTNKDNIVETYIESGPIGDEKLEYTLPICGPLYTGVVVNKETCPIEITSFADLANSALKDQVWCANATISLYGGALKALGYSIDSTDDGELQEAQELLTKIKANVKAFGSNSISALETGDVSVAYTYDYNMLMCDDKTNWDKFEIIPETTLGYTQYWSIAASSDKQDLANEFINFTYSKEAAVAVATEWGGVPIVKQELIEDSLDSDFFDNPMISEFEEMWPSHEELAVSDEQTSKTDVLYNELMADQ